MRLVRVTGFEPGTYRFDDSKAERVLDFSGQLRVLPPKVVASLDVSHPALTKYEKEVVSRIYDPAHAALEAKLLRAVIELDHVGERQEGRNCIVDL